MSGSLRYGAAVGLSVFLLGGVLSPSAATAVPPSPAPTPSATSKGQQPHTTYSQDPSGFSLTVSPARLVLGQADVGKTQDITLVNRGKAPLTVLAEKRNFSASRNGSLTYTDNAPYAASNWVTLSRTRLTIAAGTAEVVRATVKAPPKFEPGDHQVAVVFMVPAGKTKENIKINRGVATPVYITAPGPVTDSVFLSDLKAPRFTAGGAVNVTATIHNNGTVHHDFRSPSPLTVHAAGHAEAFPDFTVPRDSIRDVSTTWKPPFLCVCHATVTLTSPKGGVVTQSVRVIVFPWQWFAGGLGVLLLTLLLVRLARRSFHRQVLKAAAAHASGSGGDA